MKMRDIPADKAREVFSFGKSAEERRSREVRVQVLVDPASSRELVASLRDALVPETPRALVLVDRLQEGVTPVLPQGTDIVLVVAGGSDGLTAPAVSACLASGVPCCVVAESSVDAPSAPAGGDDVGLVAATSPEALLDKLGRWIVGVTDKDLALAANFPFVRGPKVDQLIRTCAAENAAVGAVVLIPGADMPVMTANQAKLALEIAAVYGRDLRPERIPEIAGVIGGGFAYRAAARQLLGLIPGLGVLLKAGVGYAGTIATGTALRARFEVPNLLEAGGRK